MKKNGLGNTGIYLSELGFGCSGLWGKNILGRPAITDEQATELILTALDGGITFFDTGFNYGLAEERLGRILKQVFTDGHAKRCDLVIETKAGETLSGKGGYGRPCYHPDWIRRSLEISLRRLQLDYVDLFALHGGRPENYTDNLLTLLEDLKSQGIIRAYGVNTFETDALEWVGENKCFDYVMCDYNILRQDREPLIARLQKAGVGVIGGAALAQNLFSKEVCQGGDIHHMWYTLRALRRFRPALRYGRHFKFLNDYHGYSGSQLALRYVLDNQYVSSSVFNTINPEHLKENILAPGITMPPEIRSRIIEEGRNIQATRLDH